MFGLDDITLPPNQDSEIEEILHICRGNTKSWCELILPNVFSRPFASVHDELFYALDDDNLQKVVIKAPRGWGKTSIVNIGYASKRICFQDDPFIVPITASAANATTNSENLKAELKENSLIRELFGPMESDKWATEQWRAKNGAVIIPRGSGSQIRGLNVRVGDKIVRPTLFIIDDFEDDEEVMNDELRKKNKRKFYGSILKAVDKSERADTKWRIIYIDTLKHEDSLLQNLLDDPDWYHVDISLCDENYKSTWPDYISDAQIQKELEEHRRQNVLDVFYREYMGIAISLEDAVFRQQYFRHYEESEEKLDSKPWVENVVLVDPAKSIKIHSADSAIVGVGVSCKDQKIYFRDCVHGKMRPDQIYDETFKMAQRLKARCIGIEVNSLNEFITQPFINEMNSRGLWFEIVELKPRDKKERRVEQLSPYYRKGVVYHNRRVSGALEAQLLSFPRPKKWDVMDAFAYLLQLMENGSRYFIPFNNPQEDSEDIYEKMYEQDMAENEELELAWRII